MPGTIAPNPKMPGAKAEPVFGCHGALCFIVALRLEIEDHRERVHGLAVMLAKHLAEVARFVFSIAISKPATQAIWTSAVPTSSVGASLGPMYGNFHRSSPDGACFKINGPGVAFGGLLVLRGNHEEAYCSVT
jgi:hypothetical protein